MNRLTLNIKLRQAPASAITFLVILWYSYKSLRVVYQRSALRTITTMIGLFFSYSFVFLVCMVILVVGLALFD